MMGDDFRTHRQEDHPMGDSTSRILESAWLGCSQTITRIPFVWDLGSDQYLHGKISNQTARLNVFTSGSWTTDWRWFGASDLKNFSDCVGLPMRAKFERALDFEINALSGAAIVQNVIPNNMFILRSSQRPFESSNSNRGIKFICASTWRTRNSDD